MSETPSAKSSPDAAWSAHAQKPVRGSGRGHRSNGNNGGRSTRSRRRGRWLVVTALVLVALLVATGTAAVGYYRWCQGASGAQSPVSFTIPPGQTGSGVVASLKTQGVIRCDAVSRYIVKSRGVASSFEAGEYHLQTNMTLNAALAQLSHGPEVKTVTMPVPEGWRLTQIADAAQKDLGIPSGQFLARAQSGAYSLPPYLPAGHGTTEGFLFPKTYTFAKDSVTADSVIKRLLAQFKSETANLPWSHAKALGVTPYQVVTIASMIERETAVPSERPLIAAVIYNRLNRGEILGIDATLQYIDPNPADGLTESDLQIKSPYNTRLYKGLPPTPIGSPSLASIRAALNPAHSDVGYYVACGGNGHHKFTASYSDFLRLKQQCLG